MHILGGECARVRAARGSCQEATRMLHHAEAPTPSPWDPRRRAGQGAALVARPKRRAFPGNPDQARHARLFVTRALDGCPAADTAVLLTSELVTNAISHTHTSEGGSFEIIVWRGLTAACIAVLDSGSDEEPVSRSKIGSGRWPAGLPCVRRRAHIR